MIGKNQIQTLQQFAESLVAELQQKAPTNTGALKNSIDYKMDDEGFSIEMLEYGDFINKGINGTEVGRGSIFSFSNKRPPISSISSYAKSIGANPYALQNSIFRKGIKPSLFIDNTITNDKFEKLADDLVESIWSDFVNQENNK